MKRKIISGLLCACAATTFASASQKVLNVGAYGGSTQEILTKKIFPKFEKEHNVKINYSAGKSTSTLAKLLAQENNPDLDFAIIDVGPMSQAVARGLCQPIDDVIEKMPLYDMANFANGKAVALGNIATGLAYNKTYFKKMGWDAPTSWYDLTNAKYKGKLGFQPITNGYGLLSVVALNSAEGGSLDNIDKGLDLIKKTTKNLVKNYEGSSAKLSEQFQSGEVVLAPWGSGRTYSLSQSGFDVGFVYPKEKAIALFTSMCVVKNNNNTDLSKKLVEYMLSEDVQLMLAKDKAWGPVNKNVQVPKEMVGFMPTGENASKIRAVDWNVINQNIEKWTKTWVRQVEN